LLVADIAKLVDALGGGSTLLALGSEHGLNKFRDIIESWWLGRSALWGRGLLRNK
jgi:hypothetical protein